MFFVFLMLCKKQCPKKASIIIINPTIASIIDITRLEQEKAPNKSKNPTANLAKLLIGPIFFSYFILSSI